MPVLEQVLTRERLRLTGGELRIVVDTRRPAVYVLLGRETHVDAAVAIAGIESRTWLAANPAAVEHLVGGLLSEYAPGCFKYALNIGSLAHYVKPSPAALERAEAIVQAYIRGGDVLVKEVVPVRRMQSGGFV